MNTDRVLELLKTHKDELYTAVLGDIMDTHDMQHQFLHAGIRPLLPDMKVAGLAMPVLMMDVYGSQDRPFGRLTQALDDLRSGEVYIAAGASYRSANWGELLTAAAKARGAVGAVVDGYHRDTHKVLSLDFPVFSLGSFGQDSGPRMKVADFRTPIEIGGVTIRTGDVVFGDVDGVLTIPRDCAEDVISLALEKARKEQVVRRSIEEGMTATAAFEKYGVL